MGGRKEDRPDPFERADRGANVVLDTADTALKRVRGHFLGWHTFCTVGYRRRGASRATLHIGEMETGIYRGFRMTTESGVRAIGSEAQRAAKT